MGSLLNSEGRFVMKPSCGPEELAIRSVVWVIMGPTSGVVLDKLYGVTWASKVDDKDVKGMEVLIDTK